MALNNLKIGDFFLTLCVNFCVFEALRLECRLSCDFNNFNNFT